MTWPPDTSFFILACSGPLAIELAERSVTVGHICALIGGFVTLVLAYEAWRLRRFTVAFGTSGLLLAIHPAWTVAVLRGDCSTPRIAASYAATGVFLALVIVQYVFAKRNAF